MRLFFTRHGESQANFERVISNRDLPHPLTAKGRTQALALAEQMATEPIIAIYASPILRAQQTAQIVGERLALPIITRDALREFDCGVMEGHADEEAWTAHHQVTAAWAEGDYAQAIPGGESYLDMQARFVPFVDQLVTQYAQSHDAILLISHGSLLHQMLPLVLVNVERAFVAQHPLRNCACICTSIKNGTLSCDDWDGLAVDFPIT